MDKSINSQSANKKKNINPFSILKLKKITQNESKFNVNLNDSKASLDNSSIYRLNNNKNKLKTDNSLIFNTNVNQMSLSPGKNDFNSKNMIEINKTNNFLDKVISSVGEKGRVSKTKKVDSYSSLDEGNHETMFLTKLSSIEKKLSTFTFYSPNEKGENFVLIEKNYSDNLKSENETLKNKLTNLKDQLNEAKENYNRIAAEATFIKQVNESQQKLKNENTKRSKVLQKDIEETKKSNEQLKIILTGKKMSKDDLERAICNYTNLYDSKFYDELKSLYQKYNNQYFMARYKPTDEVEIQKMLGVMSLLEKQIASKNNEIKGLNKYLKVEENDVEKDNLTVKTSSKSLRRVSSKIK